MLVDFGSYGLKHPHISAHKSEYSYTIEVQDKGPLRPIREFELSFTKELSEYQEKIKNSHAEKNDSNVTINLSNFNMDFDNFLDVVWSDAREEWVGFYHHIWLESQTIGMIGSATGPYALDEKYAKKILEAYQISEGILPLEKVLQTEPSELEKYASRSI